MDRKKLIVLIKLVFSITVVVLIYGKVMQRDGGDSLLTRLTELSLPWLLAAACMQLSAIGLGVLRWDLLLRGQGLKAPRRHLFGSFMIGRFFGAFTPSGIGLQGFRLYDIAVNTGKSARSTATIGIEMVLGNLAFAAVIVAGSIFGLRFIGVQGVVMVNAFFLSLIAAAIVLIAKPALFRVVASRLPSSIQQRLQTTVDAVCAYQGRSLLVSKAALLGMGVHTFNNLIYVCAAQALGVELGVGEVFFASGLQIFATLLPASINGVGLRELTAVALYTQVGVPDGLAILIPTVGFAVEMSISSIGGLIFLTRRVGYRVEIEVEDAEHENMVHAQITEAPASSWPNVLRGASLGLSGGALGGFIVGVAESLVTLLSGAATPDYSVLWYGGLAYGFVCAGLGLGLGLFLAISGRMMKREAVAEPLAFARLTALWVALFGLPIAAFRIRRDVFREELVWKSIQGLGILVACMLCAFLVYLLVGTLLRRLTEHPIGQKLLRPLGTPVLLVALLLGLFAFAAGTAPSQAPAKLASRTAKSSKAGNILFIVVDTLRADHLPLWGNKRVQTPALEAFANDAIRFENAYANASWTRPSFASLMTGRLPSSHHTMAKSDSLPGSITTLAEALQSGGYQTFGTVTNYNVAPFFNFHQGFDEYVYLEPEFVLGANDTAAKLLLVQALRQKIERFKTRSGRVDVGSAYQEASEVNRSLLNFLDRKQASETDGPFYMFAGYMDPHDPYYPHPYDGTGYSRAANQKPAPEEAPKLRALYEGEITFWDSKFGELIAELKRRGLYEDMTIVVTSDHGEEFMEHGGFWHGTTLYDEQVHVPLLIKFPGTAGKGTTLRHWVQSIDLMPTLLEGAGLAVPDGVQGQNVAHDAGNVFSEESHEGNVLRALRTRREGAEIKLIEANPGNPRGLTPKELYEVDRDAEEQHNMAGDLPRVLTYARDKLKQAAQTAKKGQAQRSTVDVNSDDNAVERLRALGYGGE